VELPANEPPEYYLTGGQIDIKLLGQPLDQGVRQSSTASSVSPATVPEPQSSEDHNPTRTHRNTIMTSKQKEVETAKKEKGIGLSIRTQKPKVREPSTFDGDIDNLRAWLAQL